MKAAEAAQADQEEKSWLARNWPWLALGGAGAAAGGGMLAQHLSSSALKRQAREGKELTSLLGSVDAQGNAARRAARMQRLLGGLEGGIEGMSARAPLGY
jgi:hypothetical protein